jgi:hypothetical protein
MSTNVELTVAVVLAPFGVTTKPLPKATVVTPVVVLPPPLTEIDPPPPDGVAQVPSPRQKVEDEALVPELRLVTGRLPVTSAERLTAPKVGSPAAAPCRTVVDVPSEPTTPTAVVPLPRTMA